MEAPRSALLVYARIKSRRFFLFLLTGKALCGVVFLGLGRQGGTTYTVRRTINLQSESPT